MLIIPVFLFREIRFLIRHPKTFSPLATILWVLITAASIPFMENKPTLGLVPVIHAIAVGVYYWAKWYKPITKGPKKQRVKQPHGPRRYRTAKEIDDIIKKITSK